MPMLLDRSFDTTFKYPHFQAFYTSRVCNSWCRLLHSSTSGSHFGDLGDATYNHWGQSPWWF